MIKLAPVLGAIRARPNRFSAFVLFTGQHRELLTQAAAEFSITADADLAVMDEGQSLASLTARLLEGIDGTLVDWRPDLVLAQGDTTSVLAAAMASYYQRIPFGHVEAGLRTNDLYRPFPEAGNRRLTGPLARFHFAPTEQARLNLLGEGIPDDRITVTGNTVVDALNLVVADDDGPHVDVPAGRVVVMTLHRREIFGSPLRDILTAIGRVFSALPDVTLIYPVHPNPNVASTATEILGNIPNIKLISPLGYRSFIGLLRRACLIVSDSGGIQEEAPALGIPLLVLRDHTERPEGVSAGSSRLVGTDPAAITRELTHLLSTPAALAEMTCSVNPFGDGRASQRIIAVIESAEFA
jgi:UDP-N-acetylglucosamine 2-epimerase (non-hydrolysing)